MHIMMCFGTACLSSGAERVKAALLALTAVIVLNLFYYKAAGFFAARGGIVESCINHHERLHEDVLRA
jgi:preprotein translocase subunit SecD